MTLDTNPRIQHTSSRRQYLDRIQIELVDFRTLGQKGRYAEDHVSQGFFIYRRCTAIPPQEADTLELIDHVDRVLGRNRMQSEDGILEDIDQDATGATGNEWPKRRIVHGADKHLDTARDHPLDEEAGKLSAKPLSEVFGRTTHGVRIGKVETHRLPFCLVQHRRSDGLERDRESHTLGRTHCIVGAAGQTHRRALYANCFH
jgi:hypothetical protein